MLQMASPLSLPSTSRSGDLEQLARWRTLGARRSDEVVELGQRVLDTGNLGDQEWSIREQVAIAALDLGKLRLAIDQLDILQQKFPGSPRVKILHGIRLEARGDSIGARAVYEGLLEEDETNVSAHQRLIALSLSSPTTSSLASTTLPLLLKYLDTFYSDPAGWSLLTELYCDLGMYGQALTSIGHLMLIQSWDSGAVLRAGEIGYTMGDYQLSLKYFLRATEMESEPEGSTVSVERVKTRSWWGVKLATRRLLDSRTVASSSVPPNLVIPEAKLEVLNQLATERLLGAGGAGLGVIRNILGGGDIVR